MDKAGKVIKFVKQIYDATNLHANAVSKCQYCSCKIDSGEKMTVLDHAPDAICGHCNHRIDAHLDWYENIFKNLKKIKLLINYLQIEKK